MLANTTRNRRNPADPFELLSREFDRVLGRYMDESGASDVGWAPYGVDVHEDGDHFYVDAELPGFNQDDIDVTLENGVLTIRAQRKSTEKKGEPLHVERRWAQFQRSFTLPTQVNESNVQAALHNGVLTITLDKREEVKPRRIQVKAGDGQPQLDGRGQHASPQGSPATQRVPSQTGR